MANYYTIITNIGKSKIANAQLLDQKIDITEIAVGSEKYNPQESQNSLKNEVWRGNIGLIEIDSKNPNWIVLEAIIPSNVGRFMINEVGVFDSTGDMIAVGKYPETYKPDLEEGSSKDLYLRMIIEVSNASSVELKIDPTIAIPSQDWVNKRLDRKVNKVEGKDLSTNDYTDAEKEKLSSIEEGANKYTHPDTHQASMIVENTEKRFVSDAEKENWNSKETPEGAQEKANQALADAKEYTDQSLEMGKYKWQYNESTDSLDLVVIE